MGDERKTVQQYLDALGARADYGRYFTDDVVVTVEGSDQRAEGREAGEQLIRYMHEMAFDARPELKNLLVDEGKAAIEADFAGTHTAGIPNGVLRRRRHDRFRTSPPRPANQNAGNTVREIDPGRRPVRPDGQREPGPGP